MRTIFLLNLVTAVLYLDAQTRQIKNGSLLMTVLSVPINRARQRSVIPVIPQQKSNHKGHPIKIWILS
jgi:hypothetical protein